MVGARVISALTNFTVNRIIMHDGGSRPSTSSSLVRYATLAVCILAANAALMEALTGLGASLLVAKILTELILIPVSFAVQRRWVFADKPSQESGTRKADSTRIPAGRAQDQAHGGSYRGVAREQAPVVLRSGGASGLRALSYESARLEAAGLRGSRTRST